MVKVEALGTKQKKTCFGCGSVISFENNDIQTNSDGTFIECPVCSKRIRVNKINHLNKRKWNDTEIGRRIKEALENADDTSWDDEGKNNGNS